MPPKRKPEAGDDAAETEADVGSTRTTVSPTITMSEEMLHTLVSNITRTQAEANRVLIESILSGNHSGASSPRPDVSSQSQRPGNFAKCTARFDGKSKDADELEAFIDAIEVFRECCNVSEEHALRGLPMLLVADAAVWWQGAKATVTSWPDAIDRLRGRFGAPRPGYKLFRDIFSVEQSDDRADVFVCRIRALLAKLPYVLPEEAKIDIVYGLLDRRIRKRVPRDAVDGLERLISKVRLVEEALAEVSFHDNTSDSARFVNPLCSSVRSDTAPSVNPLRTAGDLNIMSPSANVRPLSPKSCKSDTQKRTRPKCSYCKLFGHTVDNCRKKNRKVEASCIESDNSSSLLRCYGCGQLGVVRSNCSNCREPGYCEPDFCTAHVVDTHEPRPMVEIQVANRKGVAILDTGASHSLASPTLHNFLASAGVPFSEYSRTIGLADGSQQVRTILECKTTVTLRGRVIPTTFMVFPGAQTRTLLGRDFINSAGILLDIPQSSWCFNDESRQRHLFITSFKPPTAKQDPMKAAGLAVQGDEGVTPAVSKVTSSVRANVSNVTKSRYVPFRGRGRLEKVDVFPTPYRQPISTTSRSPRVTETCSAVRVNPLTLADRGRIPVPNYAIVDHPFSMSGGSGRAGTTHSQKDLSRLDWTYRRRAKITA